MGAERGGCFGGVGRDGSDVVVGLGAGSIREVAGGLALENGATLDVS